MARHAETAYLADCSPAGAGSGNNGTHGRPDEPVTIKRYAAGSTIPAQPAMCSRRLATMLQDDDDFFVSTQDRRGRHGLVLKQIIAERAHG